MHISSRKIVLVGTGMVGTSYAYALLNQNACDELVLIDLDTKRAQGEAMDLSHGLAFDWSSLGYTCFHSIGLGTLVTTAINSPLISLMGRLIDKIFTSSARFPKLEKALKR